MPGASSGTPPASPARRVGARSTRPSPGATRRTGPPAGSPTPVRPRTCRRPPGAEPTTVCRPRSVPGGGPSTRTVSVSTPITASIAAPISATVGASGSQALRTRDPGRAAASRISSAMLWTLAGWKRLAPPYARIAPATAVEVALDEVQLAGRAAVRAVDRARPQQGRRQLVARGEEFALQRDLAGAVRVVTGRYGAPALRDRHRVLGKPVRLGLGVETAPLVVLVHRQAGDHHGRADAIGQARQLPCVCRPRRRPCRPARRSRPRSPRRAPRRPPGRAARTAPPRARLSSRPPPSEAAVTSQPSRTSAPTATRPICPVAPITTARLIRRKCTGRTVGSAR